MPVAHSNQQSSVKALEYDDYGFCSQSVYGKFSALSRNTLFTKESGCLLRAHVTKNFITIISHCVVMRKWVYNNHEWVYIICGQTDQLRLNKK